MIQIREKSGTPRDFFEDAAAAVRIAHDHDVVILINDRADIALMAGADGVHLGQHDLPPEAARRMLGDKAVIGISTHSVDEVSRALAQNVADYIAFGPVFGTVTKSDHEPVVGLEKLAQIRKIVGHKPLVAIGGIKVDTLAGVFAAGADSAAIISDLYPTDMNISERYRYLCEISNNNNVVNS